MAFILKNGIWRRNQVPNFPVELDYSRPLTNGLAFFSVPGSIYGFQDLTGRAGPVSINAGAPPASSTLGRVAAFDGTTQYAGVALDLSAYSEITVSAHLQIPTSFTSTGLVWEYTANGYGATNGGFAFAVNDPTSSGMSFGFGQAPAAWADSIVKPDGLMHHYSVIYNRNAGIAVYVDGQPAAQTPIVHNTFSYGNFANDTLHIFNRATGSLLVQGSIGSLAVHARSLSGAEILRLYSEPFGMLKAKISRQFYLLPTIVAGGTSVSPTGQASTSGQGSITPTVNTLPAGQAMTSAQGSITPTVKVAIAGQAMTSAQGAITDVVNVSISGQPATMGQGSVSAGGSLNISIAGQAMTAGQGSLAYTVACALAGQAANCNQGAVGIAKYVAISGQAMTSAQGSLAYTVACALLGQAASCLHGDLPFGSATYDIDRGFDPIAFDGGAFYEYIPIFMTSQQGLLHAGPAPGLTGLPATAGQGTISVKVNVTLLGQTMTLGQGVTGIAGAPQNVNLSGQAMTSAQGVLSLKNTLALLGQSAGVGQGALTLTFATVINITGLQAACQSGILTPANVPDPPPGDMFILAGNGDLVVPGEYRFMSVPPEDNVRYGT